MKSYLSPRQNPIQSMYFVIGSKCHFSSQQMPPKNKYTNSPKTWKWKLPWRKSVPRCLLVDKSESNNNVLIIISKSKCISRKSCLMPCLKTILNCFALEHSAFKTKHLKVINGFLPIMSWLFYWTIVSESLFGSPKYVSRTNQTVCTISLLVNVSGWLDTLEGIIFDLKRRIQNIGFDVGIRRETPRLRI